MQQFSDSGHRLIACPHRDECKSTSTQQPSRVLTKIESAKSEDTTRRVVHEGDSAWQAARLSKTSRIGVGQLRQNDYLRGNCCASRFIRY